MSVEHQTIAACSALNAVDFKTLTEDEMIIGACECLTGYISTLYVDPYLAEAIYVKVLLGLSCFFDGLNFFFISQFNGLKRHPMKLYMWLSFAYFFLFWTMLIAPNLCDLKL